MFGTRQLGQRWETYRPTKALLVWSCAVGAIGVIVVGFTWGGWVTGGTARTMAQAAARARTTSSWPSSAWSASRTGGMRMANWRR